MSNLGSRFGLSRRGLQPHAASGTHALPPKEMLDENKAGLTCAVWGFSGFKDDWLQSFGFEALDPKAPDQKRT